MSRPDFVYLDLGNVLLFFDHGLAARSMAKIIGVTPDVIKRTVFDSELQIAYERGERTTSQFVSILSEQFGKKLSPWVTIEYLRSPLGVDPSHAIPPSPRLV